MLRPARKLPRAADRHARGRQARSRRHFLALDIEPLESRQLLAPILVTSNAGDMSGGTLYAAITQSNSTRVLNPSSPNVIVFSGSMDIQLQQPLPQIIQPVIIDGYSEGGSVNTLPTGDNATIPVQIDGSLLGAGIEGLRIAAYNCMVDGLSITGFKGSGIDIQPPSASPPADGAIGATIWGDWIGVAPDGSARGNQGAGVIVADSNNAIGGTLPGGRDLIENSGDAGIILCGSLGYGNLVEGDFIIGNGGDGVLVLSANNVIGQPVGVQTAGAGDVISGNGSNGVSVRGPSAQGNIVANDLIGTTIDGMSEMPNQGNGVLIEDAPGNMVGGTAANTPDVIAGNRKEGVLIENDQGDPLPSVPAPVMTDIGGIALNTPATDATANVVQGDLIGYNITGNVLSLMPNTDGVFISSSGNTVGGSTAAARNVIIANGRDGIVISSAWLGPENNQTTPISNADPTYNLVQGNFVGTQAGGDDYGNTLDGLLLVGATGNTIGGPTGGPTGGDANVISGNNYGIVVIASLIGPLPLSPGGRNVIEGDLIGSMSNGLAPLPNAFDGILIDGVPNNTIGGTASGTANVISGNGEGIRLIDQGATGNAVWGNFIGSDITGTIPVRNAGDGVFISSSLNNTVGGLGSGEGNTIAFNTGNGVEIGDGGMYQTVDDAILTNSIFSNGPNPTTPGGPAGVVLDGLANEGIGAPTVLHALPDKVLDITEIDVYYAGEGNATYLIQFFSTPAGGPKANVQGQTWIGSKTVNTGPVDPETGYATVQFPVNVGTVVATGSWITATATLLVVDPISGATYSETSEFSNPPIAAVSPFLVTSTVDQEPPPSQEPPDQQLAALTPGTLRYAVTFSNFFPSPIPGSPNTIEFEIPGIGLQTISLLASLTITSTIVIDGYSQPGSHANDSSQYPPPDTYDDQETDIATIEVQLDGSQIRDANAIGLDVQAPGCTIDGLSLTGFSGAAISLEDVSNTITGAVGGNTVWGNFIGVSQFNSQSTAAVVATNNAGANGVGILIDSPNNIIGGSSPPDRNVIQANAGDGVIVYTAGATGSAPATGNVIGTNFILDNGGDGVLLLTANNHVGLTAGGQGLAGGGNLISGNQQNGVQILGTQARGNTIVNDEIGTRVGLAGQVVPLLGTRDHGNVGSGVLIEDAQANTIGGVVGNSANVLAGNVLDGITIENLNGGAPPLIVPTQPSPSSTTLGTRNVVEGNLIGFNDRNGQVEPIGNHEDGVSIASSSNTVGGSGGVAQNVILDNGRNGITIAGSPLQSNDVPVSPVPGASISRAVTNLVEGNLIGTDSFSDDGANNYDGILLEDAASNTIGGTVSGTGNVISDNHRAGIAIANSLSAANLVAGNLVGLTANATGTMANGIDGIWIDNAPANIIGGTTSAAANVIAGNTTGVYLFGSNASSNLLEGNFIGTNSSGSNQFSNSGDGVAIDGGAWGNTIGGNTAGAGNTIAYNGGFGVDVLSGVWNSILSNSMFLNSLGGIMLVGSANDALAAPTIASVTDLSTSTQVQGTLAASVATAYLIQIFTSTAADASGSYEGQTLVGSTVTTDINGVPTFGLTISSSIPIGVAITATATSLDSGDTSEFSTQASNAPLITFSAGQYYVSTPASAAVITLVRNSAAVTSTVVYSALPFTAIAGVDFTSITSAVTFAPGQTSATFSVPILDPPGRFGAFTVELSLKNASGAGLPKPATAILTITSAPGTLQFSSSGVTVPESSGGVTITVDRVDGASGTVSVSYATAALNAIPGVDFVAVSGTLTFPPGVTQESFTLPILGNSPNPNDATIALELSAPAGGASLGTPTTEIVTIDKPLIVTGQQLSIGGGGISSVILSFNKPLDPAQAGNLANFGFFVYWANASGVFVGGGLTSALATAAYNPANASVTLIPAAVLPFNHLYRLAVDGSASPVLGNGLTDASGGELEGSSGVPGTPYVVTFGAGNRLTYADAQRNVVTLQLRRGGIMTLFQSPGGAVQQLELIGAVPNRSTLTGSVKRGPGGTGRTTLPPIAGAGGVHIKFRGRPFVVTRTARIKRESKPFARRAWHR